MMGYRVLIVDDEPIILSGIRHLIDWEKADAEIIGAAGNGEEAYSIIEREHPDIVITDIKMPVMDGLALAGKCSEEFPEIVFIILTSLEEFSLAKEAIGYGVSDYLLKTELDGGRLAKALEKAESESLKRRESYGIYSNDAGRDSLPAVISSLMIMRDIPQETRSFLHERGILQDFAFIAFVLSFPPSSLDKQWSREDYARLHDWEEDIVGKILPSAFSSFWPVVPVAGKAGTLIYFISGIAPNTWEASAAHVEAKVRSASSMVTGLCPEFIRTPVMSGRDGLRRARSILEMGLMASYLGKDQNSIVPSSLDIDSVFPRLENSISKRDIASCRACFSIIRSAMENSDHSLSQFSFMTAALSSAISSGLSAIGLSGDRSWMDLFDNIDFISKRTESLAFIDDVSDSLLGLIESRSGTGSNVADKAREYVIAHVAERISLDDVADFAGVSSGYMSKSFKRIMGISLVDYINSMKIERAKEIMDQNHDARIADIAIALGFSNVYYFSKVFRKVEGVPPTEYLKRS